MILVNAAFTVKEVGEGGVLRSPGSPSSGGIIPSVTPTALFGTFTIPESFSSRKVTALSNGSPRKPNLISNACFISSRASFSSLSVLGGIFFRPGSLVLIMPLLTLRYSPLYRLRLRPCQLVLLLQI